MKKTVCLLLLLAVCLSFTVYAAADGAQLSVGDVTGCAGDTVTVPITLTGNAGLAFLKIYIDYDSASLELVEVRDGGALGGMVFTPNNNPAKRPFPVTWTGSENSAGNGTLVYATFTIRENAAVGAKTVSVSVSECYSIDPNNAENYGDVAVAALPGAVTIKNAPVTVNFDPNGGVNAPEAATVSAGDALTLPMAYPTREKHLFLGWAESKEAENAQYKRGASFTPAGDMTLYAVWLDLTTPDFKLPASLTIVEDEAFAGTAVRYAAFPEGLTKIGSRIFAGCTKLIAVYAPALVTNLLADAFDSVPETLTLLGRLGSAIADYAAEHGFRFEPVETNPIP